MVDAHPLGEGPDEVLRRRRREDDLAAGPVVLLDEHAGEGLDELGEPLPRDRGRLVEGVDGAPARDEGGLPGEGDRSEGLAEEVEVTEDRPLEGQPALDHARLTHRRRERRPGGPAQEGPVEVEEGCRTHGGQPTGPPSSQAG